MNESLQRGNLISFKMCGEKKGLHVFILEMKNILDLPKQSHIFKNYLERKRTVAMGGKSKAEEKICRTEERFFFKKSKVKPDD